MTAGLLATALAFARHGHAVLPLFWPVKASNGRLVCSCRKRTDCPSAAKHPYGELAPNGLLSATTETGIVKMWFGLRAPHANLGVCTNKLVVLDVDPRNGGDESLAALEKDYGPLPPTWRTITGSGGLSTRQIMPRCKPNCSTARRALCIRERRSVGWGWMSGRAISA